MFLYREQRLDYIQTPTQVILIELDTHMNDRTGKHKSSEHRVVRIVIDVHLVIIQ